MLGNSSEMTRLRDPVRFGVERMHLAVIVEENGKNVVLEHSDD